MTFKKQPKIFTNYDASLPADAMEITGDGMLPLGFVLSKLTNKFISYIRSKDLYSEELIDHLVEECELVATYNHHYRDDSKQMSCDFFYHGCMIRTCNEDSGSVTIQAYIPTGVPFDFSKFEKFKIHSSKSRISILVKGNYGLETRSIKIDPIKIQDINLNYGRGFDQVHENIVEKLNRPNSSIMFFHGPPGCGKSSYIKYLTNVLDKEFIFIPVAFAGELSSPDFMNLLLDHKDSVLILEDSEKVVQSRDQDDHNVSTVSTLLNISDGILGSMLNIKIVATYNGNKDLVDKALLRPGRLAIDHTFGKLDPETATALAKKLGKDVTFYTDMTLAEVYNHGDVTGYKEKTNRKIGFCV